MDLEEFVFESVTDVVQLSRIRSGRILHLIVEQLLRKLDVLQL